MSFLQTPYPPDITHKIQKESIQRLEQYAPQYEQKNLSGPQLIGERGRVNKESAEFYYQKVAEYVHRNFMLASEAPDPSMCSAIVEKALGSFDNAVIGVDRPVLASRLCERVLSEWRQLYSVHRSYSMPVGAIVQPVAMPDWLPKYSKADIDRVLQERRKQK